MDIQEITEKLLNKETTRREFLKAAGKTVAAAAIASSVLSLFGCSTEAEKKGGVTGLPLPTSLLAVDRARCTGCGRCEIVCGLTHDGKVQPSLSRLKVDRTYNFGIDGPRLSFRYADGQYGNTRMTPETCRQCRAPFCANACPHGAILPDKKTGARTVQADRCQGCGNCVTACPWGMVALDTERSLATKCVTCGACVGACPTGALSVIPWDDLQHAAV